MKHYMALLVLGLRKPNKTGTGSNCRARWAENSRWVKVPVPVLLGFLTAVAGCGDLGENRREATGSVGGVGLTGDLEAGTAPPLPSTPPSPQSAAPQLQTQSQAPPLPPAQGQAPPLPGASPTATAPGQGAPQPEPTQMVREKAQPGVTGKGNYGPGLITTPARAYFTVREQIIFNALIPKAMQLYEASNNGVKPKTQEEFMEKIVVFNMIQLPELPVGHRYVYDPEQGELLVEHPE